MNAFKRSIAIITTITSVVLGVYSTVQYPAAYGYGYGYGTTTCTASAPTGLAVAYSANKKHITFTWNPVTFSNCASATPVSYTLQVRKPDSSQVLTFTGLTNSTKTIKASALPSNAPFKFKVRAVATDAAVTEWSMYKAFRTLPNIPKQLQITIINNHPYFSWQNIRNSDNLQYYLVKVRRGDRVVFSKRVHTGLRNTRTGTFLSNVRRGINYNFTVQAVGRANSRSAFAELRSHF